MFKFLKNKIKDVVSKFTQKVEEERPEEIKEKSEELVKSEKTSEVEEKPVDKNHKVETKLSDKSKITITSDITETIASQTDADGISQPKKKTAPGVENDILDEPKTISPQDIHELADSKKIIWDNEPSFLEFTKYLTGKEHLDDLSELELQIIEKAIMEGQRPVIKSLEDPDKDQEMRDVVDENDIVISQATRRDVRNQKLLHRGVGVLLFNSEGKLLIQKRVENKDLYPGMYDLSASGGVNAGEDLKSAAERELKEEVGVTASVAPLFVIRHTDEFQDIFAHIFTATYDGPIVLQEEEVASAEWMTLDEIQKLIENKEICPDVIKAIVRYKEDIEKEVEVKEKETEQISESEEKVSEERREGKELTDTNELTEPIATQSIESEEIASPQPETETSTKTLVGEENIAEKEAPIEVLKESKPGFFSRMFGNRVEKPAEKISESVEPVSLPKPTIVEAETPPKVAEQEKNDQTAAQPTEHIKEEATGFLSKLKQKIVTTKISEEQFQELFWDLEMAMLENNVAVEVIEKMKIDLSAQLVNKPISRGKVSTVIFDALRSTVDDVLTFEIPDILKKIAQTKPYVMCFVGVNGSGKTTSIGKFAAYLKANHFSCLMAAGDTFRAAAIQQLEEHANAVGVKIIKHDYGSDSAAVAFDAISYAKSHSIDVVLIDTAGRLHSNTNLMDELKKVIRIAKPDLTVFVGESITGNDCVEQAQQFHAAVGIDGIILTKADVDEKGGAAISVSFVTGKPILYFGTGQTYDDLVAFDKVKVMENLGL